MSRVLEEFYIARENGLPGIQIKVIDVSAKITYPKKDHGRINIRNGLSLVFH